MENFPIFGGVFALLVSIYVWVRDNNKIRACFFIAGIFWLAFTCYSLVRYDQEGLTYLASKYRFCSGQGDSAGCLFSGKYERDRRRDMTIGPASNVCQYCRRPTQIVTRDVLTYVKIEQENLVADDLAKVRSQVGSNFVERDSLISEMSGAPDLGGLRIGDLNTSFGLSSRYVIPIRNDKFFPKLVNFDRSCLKRSELRLLVNQGSVVTLTWVGKIDERCFDVLWWPSLVRNSEYLVYDRNRSGNLSSYIRYKDDEYGRTLIMTSRNVDAREGSVGLWISFISPRVPLTSAYDDHAARGIFSVIDSIANEQ